MKGLFYINGKDAYVAWGATLQHGAIEALLKPPAAKPFTENEARSIPGKQVLPKNPQPTSRTFTINISINGVDFSDYIAKYEAFFLELSKGIVELKVSVINKTFRLIYKESNLKLNNYKTGFGTYRIEFEEPNPLDRENI